jgi:hypothetical protein
MIGDLPALPMMLDPPDEPQGPILKIPISEEKVALFTKEIERARILRDQKIAEWGTEKNLERYGPAPLNDPGVNVGVDFRDVERKGAALFYDQPTVNIQPGPDGNPQAAVLHQELLNGLLSAQKMNAKATALKAIKDCLVAIQPAFTKIGYLPVTVDMPQMNPMTGQPEMVPVVVHDEVFWSRMSGKAGLLPVDFRDTDYDRSPWIGYDFKKPVSQARRDFNLPSDWSPPTGGTREVTFSENKDPAGSSDPQVTGTELWYRACLFDDTVSHPELLRCLVLVDGWPTPVKHENAPWQQLDPTGRLTPDSIQGYPIHPLALRDFPDSAWVPADCSQTGPLTVEINTYLTQAKAKRDSNRLILATDVTKIDIEAAGRIADMEIFKGLNLNILPVQENALVGQNSAMMQIPTLDLGRETYLGLQIFESKRDAVLGLTAPQGGAENDSARTATEIATVQRNADARFEQERQRALSWWIRGVQKLSAFVVRYGDRCAVDILGHKRAQQWLQFREQGFLGSFTFDVMIDSGKYLDIESDRRQFLSVLNFAAKSPFIRQDTLWKTFCQKFGYAPDEWLTQPQPPKPEPPSLSMTINGDDLSEPQSPMIVEILAAQGIQISPAAIQNMVLALKAKQQAEEHAALSKQNPLLGLATAEPPGPPPPQPGMPGMPPVNPATPGPADQAERLDKHQLQESGSLPGAGSAPGPGAGPVMP